MENTHYSFEKGFHNPYSENADPYSYEYQASLFDVQTIFKDEKQEGCIIDPPIRSYLSSKVLRIVKDACTGSSRGQAKPLHLSSNYILDIFKYFYQAYQHTVNVTPDLYHWHYLLTRMDNWLLKTITDSRVLYSTLATIAICKKLNDLLHKTSDKINSIDWKYNNIKIDFMDILMKSLEG